MKKQILKALRKIRYHMNLLLGNEVKFTITKPKSGVDYLGSDYGGFLVDTSKKIAKPIVYSFGIGTEISFDRAIIKKYSAKVFAYDPTPKSIKWIEEQKLPSGFIFEGVGIADSDGKIDFHLPKNDNYVSCTTIEGNNAFSESEKITVPVQKLSSLMKKNGHDKIDILKMDIEGSEYSVIDNILEEELQVDQILVEFHHRFSSIPVSKTQNTINKLIKNGYHLVGVTDTYQEFTFSKAT